MYTNRPRLHPKSIKALLTLMISTLSLVPTHSDAGFLFWRSKPAPEPVQPPTQPSQKPAPRRTVPNANPTKPAAPSATASLRSIPPEQRDRYVKLQVFLDRSLFSPKSIDGKGGPSTLRALNAYLRAKNASPVQDEKSFDVPSDAPLYTTFTLEQQHLRFILGSPNQRYGLPYNSASEFVCERYHCSEELLATLNPSLKLNALKPGTEITVPDVLPFQIEEMVPTAAVPENDELKGRSIRVNLADRSLTVVSEDKAFATFPIAVGSPSLPTPKGKWRIYGICLLPTYRLDPGVLSRGVRTSNFKMLPPGPNSPVGVVWCGLNKPGIGIHGTNNPDSIGNAVSHGCIRVANWDVARLATLVNPGAEVLID